MDSLPAVVLCDALTKRGDPCRAQVGANGYASALIAQGEDVGYVSRTLGHASAATTLRVYAHAFDHARHATAASARLEATFGAIVSGDRPSGTVLALR